MPRIYLFLLGILAWVLWLWLGKRMVRPRRAAILATAILPTLLAIAVVVFPLLDKAAVETEGFDIRDICLLVGFGLVAAATLSSVGFAIRRKWEIAKGIGLGSGIGLVVWLIVMELPSLLFPAIFPH